MVDSLYGKTKKKSVDLKASHLVKALEKASAKNRKPGRQTLYAIFGIDL